MSKASKAKAAAAAATEETPKPAFRNGHTSVVILQGPVGPFFSATVLCQACGVWGHAVQYTAGQADRVAGRYMEVTPCPHNPPRGSGVVTVTVGGGAPSYGGGGGGGSNRD